jgi:hypothetical protein
VGLLKFAQLFEHSGRGFTDGQVSTSPPRLFCHRFDLRNAGTLQPHRTVHIPFQNLRLAITVDMVRVFPS